MNRCIIGDCRDTMHSLIAEGVKVQMCVTSPPYWGLRDYGHPEQLGLEPTPQEYVANMVQVFRLVRELLADDGTLWLNLGDSYFGGKGQNGNSKARATAADRGYVQSGGTVQMATRPLDLPQDGLKPKDLCGIPWRVAFALQADGWYLRQDIIWAKPNPMPESVTDRCTKSHEYLFLLSKSARYYYDAAAIAEPAINGGRVVAYDVSQKNCETEGDPRFATRITSDRLVGENRNKRSVWTVATQPYSEAHFATFPPKLIEPCILAGSRPGDVVLDPFFGSGTTGEVCERLGRQWLGCELSAEYGKLVEQRTAQMGIGL